MSDWPSGHINWGAGGWVFDYHVSDHEGLSLLNGSFKGVHYIGKFSLPVIRVEYDVYGGFLDFMRYHGRGAGPYADQLSWKLGGSYGLQRMTNRGGKYVGIIEYTSYGVKWLQISIYARIGAYHICQVWDLNSNGVILPKVWSKGLTINMNHRHHPYWRLDFDIDETENNRVYAKEGKNWYHALRETNDLKSKRDSPTFRLWYIRNERTGHGAWVSPRLQDHDADRFSKLDVAVRLYHKSEEIHPWSHDTDTYDKGELGFANGEEVGRNDIVFWFVSHMHHHAADGKDHWHYMGPSIKCGDWI